MLRRELKLATERDRAARAAPRDGRAADQAERRRRQGGARRLPRRAAHRSGARGGAGGPRAAVPPRGRLGRAGRGAQARAAPDVAHACARCARRSSSSSAGTSWPRRARRSWRCSSEPQGDRARGARAGRAVRAAAQRSRRGGARLAPRRRGRSARRRRRRARCSASTRRAGASPIWPRRSSASCSSATRRWSRSGALELWLKLGEIRKARLSRPESAAEAYEKALRGRSAPRRRAGGAGRDLRARSSAATISTACSICARRRPPIRSSAPACCCRRATCSSATAISTARSTAYAEAFKLDPASRTCFTALRARLLPARAVARRRWSCTRRAIQLVEVQRSRAYRLADLYARRGQLQLQYLGQPGEAAASLPARARARSRGRHRADRARAHLLGAVRLGGPDRAPTSGAPSWCSDDAKRVEILRRAARVAAAKLQGRRRGGAPLRAAARGRSRPTPRRSTRSSATTSARATGRSWSGC